jgi:Na+(H+)/acetate symporter ActP
MNWMAQHWLALALLVGYTGALLYNAYLGSQASRGMAGYYVGNREMSGIVVGISFFATFASTNTYIGHAGKAYDYGVAWFTMAILLVVFSWVSWRWIGPPLRRFACAMGCADDSGLSGQSIHRQLRSAEPTSAIASVGPRHRFCELALPASHF